MRDLVRNIVGILAGCTYIAKSVAIHELDHRRERVELCRDQTAIKIYGLSY